VKRVGRFTDKFVEKFIIYHSDDFVESNFSRKLTKKINEAFDMADNFANGCMPGWKTLYDHCKHTHQ
jgi:hypothetical protein